MAKFLMLFGAMLLCFNSFINAQCNGTNDIMEPVEFQWTYHPVSATNSEAYYSGTMEVGEVTLTLNNNETLTTRAYRQKGTDYTVPGPTLRMRPGQKYVLRLENTLPYEMPNSSHNVFKDPNIVNLHTHGLHISGESPGDDVTRYFEGGFAGDFVYDIPADHMGGTFWYHAHHHGSTLLQVAGGMFGMIIIDDSNDNLPPNVANMAEKVLAMGFLDPSVAGTGGDQLISGSLSPSWIVNGIIGGNLCIPDNTWEHWRVLIADRGAKLRDVEFGPGLEVMVLARDGVWRTTAPKELASNSNTIQLTGASRADFAIRKTGNTSSWVKVGGNIVANVHTNNEPTDLTVNPYNTDGVSLWSADRPDYLRDLRGISNVNNVSISMGARTVKGPNYGGKFDHHTPNVILPVTDVQEWSLSGNVQHPFHLHVYHVQAMDTDRDFEVGEYYDVVASQMDVRFDLNAATSTPYEGRTIMHCHILAHEDQGAMGWLDVQGGEGPPTFPDDGDIAVPYSDYYAIPGDPPTAASGLSAITISSSAIELSWTDNASDEIGFDIERSTDGVNFSSIASVGTDVTSYNDTGLNHSTLYSYRVIAFNSGGNASSSNIASASTLALPTPPNAPSSLNASASSSSTIDLSWIDNSQNEDGFTIDRSIDGVTFSIITSVDADATTYTDAGLDASTTYYYKLSAFNDGGNSATSNIANATTDAFSGPIVHVENIEVSREALNGNRFRGLGTITIHDDFGTVVSGATVAVSYNGPNSGTRSGITSGSGQISFTTNGTKNPSGDWCFEVTNVSLAGATYDMSENSVTIACESGSQSTSFTKNNNNGSQTSIHYSNDKINMKEAGSSLLGINPNPVQDEAQIIVKLQESTDAVLEIYTIVGDLIGEIANQNFEAGKHLFRLNTDQLHGGSYIILLKADNILETRRFTIIR